jgi:glyoxylase-like metal-dependent hydrolase (beta-lactamase superfamily II)
MAVVFEPLAGNTFVARGPTNLGLYVFRQGDAARALVIDSGGDEDSGRRIVRECERLGVSLAALLNTHSNADHCGGNASVYKRTGCAIAATGLEAAFLQYPQLEASFLAGAFPQKALRNKFLMAPPSRATHLLEPPCELALGERGEVDIQKLSATGSDSLHIVSLPGHYFGMVGVMTPDKVFFAADALAGAPILEKYHIFFFYDVAAELETLSMLERIEAAWFVPSHAEPVRDIRPLVGLNRAKIFEIAEVIVGLVSGDVSLEDIVADVCAHYDIILNADQHVLVGSTIRSYLSWLCDQGRLEYGFERNRMTFRMKQ